MIFRHRITKKPVLWTAPYDPSWENQDNPNLYRIRSAEDLPLTDDMVHIYEQTNMDPMAWEIQGRFGFYCYLRAFFMDDWVAAKKRGAGKEELRKLGKEGKVAEKDFWFMFLPCGFPGGVME